jgi:cbb3-type cytochrome oxidase maturation protein
VSVIFLLIAVSLLVAIGFLVSFIWSIRSGQFDDEYTPSVRILFEDEIKNPKEEERTDDTNSKFHPPAGGPNSKQIPKLKTKIAKQANRNQ